MRTWRSPLLLQGASVQCLPVSPMSTALTLLAHGDVVVRASGAWRERDALDQA